MLFVGFNFYVANQISVLGSLSRSIYKHPLVVSNAALAANRSLIKMHRSMKDVVLSDNDEELTMAIEEVNTEEKEVYKDLKIIKKNIIGKEGTNLEIKLRQLFKNWKPIRDEVIYLTKLKKYNEAEAITKGKGLKHVKLLETKMIELNMYARHKSSLFIKNVEKTQTDVYTAIIGVMIAAIVLSLLIAMVITLSITKEIQALNNAMKKSSNSGKLFAVNFSGKNEITEMVESYNILVHRLNLQSWIKDGVNEFSHLLLTEKETLNIAQKGLNFICEYGSLDFGMICHYNLTKELCDSIAIYGLKEEREFFRNVDDKRCLMAQMVKTQKEMLLTKSQLQEKAKSLNLIPKNYFLLPLIFEKKLIGVMGIGSEENLTEEKLQFIRSTGEILASSLSSASNKETLFALTQELQAKEEVLMQQNEELQAKEEELMQQNEELQAKEEALMQQNEEINSAFELLTQSEQKYRNLYNNMNECVVIYEIVYDETAKAVDLKYIDVNPYFEQALKQSRDKIIGKTFKEVFKTEDIPNFEDLIEVEKTGNPISKEVHFVSTNEDLYMSVFSPGKGILVMLFTDISSRKKDEKALKTINIELKKANQHKNQFLSTMSHELRTPLNAILGFSETLLKKYFGELNDRQHEYISLIHNSGQHLLLLINDILDISKIDSGSMDLTIEKVPCCELISSIISLLSSQYEEKRLTLNINNDCELCALQADKQKLKQILLNLLSNAIKYTPVGGSVDIKVEKYQGSYVKFSISDTGVGIKEEDMEKIFTEFYQTDYTRDQALGGSGIGLALCKRLVEMHDGKIFVESKLGEGSTFSFIIPGYYE